MRWFVLIPILKNLISEVFDIIPDNIFSYFKTTFQILEPESWKWYKAKLQSDDNDKLIKQESPKGNYLPKITEN